jgi:hypothetical protein
VFACTPNAEILCTSAYCSELKRDIRSQGVDWLALRRCQEAIKTLKADNPKTLGSGICCVEKTIESSSKELGELWVGGGSVKLNVVTCPANEATSPPYNV